MQMSTKDLWISVFHLTVMLNYCFGMWHYHQWLLQQCLKIIIIIILIIIIIIIIISMAGNDRMYVWSE